MNDDATARKPVRCRLIPMPYQQNTWGGTPKVKSRNAVTISLRNRGKGSREGGVPWVASATFKNRRPHFRAGTMLFTSADAILKL